MAKRMGLPNYSDGKFCAKSVDCGVRSTVPSVAVDRLLRCRPRVVNGVVSCGCASVPNILQWKWGLEVSSQSMTLILRERTKGFRCGTRSMTRFEREVSTPCTVTSNNYISQMTAIAGAASRLPSFSNRSGVIWNTSGNPVTPQSTPFMSFTRAGAAVKIRAMPLPSCQR